MSILQKIKDFIAGLEREQVQRDIGMQQLYEQVMMQVDSLAMSSGGYPQVMDIFTAADGNMSIVFSLSGRLYRAPITMQGTAAILGGLTEFEMPAMAARSITIARQADGTARWMAVAAASVLNRMAEIDSRALFDSFILAAPEHGYPQLRFYHDARLVMGKTDWLAREDNLYLASGTVADNELGAAFVDACEKGRGAWGCSIGFMPTLAPDTVEIARGVSIPVYQAGVNTEISVLPEAMAASWFTTIGMEVTRSMDAMKAQALATLLGDEEKAKKFIGTVDATNRQIAEAGLVTRETEPKPEDDPVTRAVKEAVTQAFERLTAKIDADEAAIVERVVAEVERHATTEAEKAQKLSAEEKATAEADLTDRIAAAIAAKYEARIAKLEEMLTKSKAEERIAKLEAIEVARQQVRREDMPPVQPGVIYRPREAHDGDRTQKVSAADAAAKTLAAIPH